MRFDIASRLDDLTASFCDSFGYSRNEFPNYSKKGEDISVDEVIRALDSIFFSFMDLEMPGYAKEFHINRVCHAIEEGTFSYPISRKVKQLYQQYKKRRWKDEAQLYGLRLRWQIRLNRIFPGANIRIPAIDEIVSHNLLRYSSVLNCLWSRIVHSYRYKTLEDFYFMDRRYGHPILVKGCDFDLINLLFPKTFMKSAAVQELQHLPNE